MAASKFMLRTLLRASAAVIAAAGGAAAQAPAEAQKQDVQSPELTIIVTADKVEQNLLDVPSSVAVIGEADLEVSRIQTIQDVALISPSVNITQQGAGTPTLRIRGVGTQIIGDSGLGNEQSVSVVVDGVVRSEGPRATADLFDTERVEVLRGPQGTLFGKNATAGVLSLITRNPSPQFESSFEVVSDEQGETLLRGVVNAPLGDKAALRVSGLVREFDGFIDNAATRREVGGADTESIRAKLLFEPSSRFRLLASLDYTDHETTGAAITERQTNDPNRIALISPLARIGVDNKVATYDGPFFDKTESWGVAVQADWDLNADHTLTSITSYRGREDSNAIDADFTPRSISPAATGAGALNELFVRQSSKNLGQTWSQELRIANSTPQTVDYIAGVFAWNSKNDGNPVQRTSELCLTTTVPAASAVCPATGPITPIGQLTTFGGDDVKEVESLAAFGQVTAHLSERVRAIAGVRLTRDEQSFSFLPQVSTTAGYNGAALAPALETAFTTQLAATNPPGTVDAVGNGRVIVTLPRRSGSNDEDNLSGKLGLQVDVTDNVNTYVTASNGYKAAAFIDQGGGFTAPEEVVAYEAGAKASLADGRVLATVAVYHNDFTDFQAQVFDPSTARFVVANAGDVRSRGVEFDMIAQPFSGLTLSAGAAYADVELKKLAGPLECYPGQTLVNPAPAAQISAAAVPPDGRCYRTTLANPLSGNRRVLQNPVGGDLPGAPDWKVNVTGRYVFDIPGFDGALSGLLGATYVWVDDVLTDLKQDPATIVKAHGTLNLNFGISGREDRWTLSVFGRNVTDEVYVTSIIATPTLGNSFDANGLTAGGNYIQVLPRDYERYWGASFKIRFGG